MNTETMFSSKDPTWGTPRKIRSLVETFAPNGTLDPCPGRSPVGEARDGNGLVGTWPTDKLVFVNPPYGKDIKPWMEKVRAEAATGCEIIALVPSRTDTHWFQDSMVDADRTLFIKGRLKFMGAKHPAPFPSVLFYWGQNTGLFMDVFGGIGHGK